MAGSRKQQREKAVRQYERQLAWEQAQAAKRRRRNMIFGAATAGILVIALVAWAVAAATNMTPPNANAAATAQATEPTAPATNEAQPEATPLPTKNQGDVPPASGAENRAWTGAIKTSVGTLDVSLDGTKAPQAVASFLSLAKKGYFDKTTCHRLTTSDQFKVLQCGDPTGTGTGTPGYSFGPIENAPSSQIYPKGTIAMARQQNNAYSNGSQFFIVYGDTTIPNDAAGGYTVFGQVTGGLDAIEKVGAAGTTTGAPDGTPKTTVAIEGITLK